jgi:hypothetical protein
MLMPIRFAFILFLLADSVSVCSAQDTLPISLSVEGVMKDKKGSVALINGSVYKIGDMIQDVKIVEITDKYVKVEYQGATYDLWVGSGNEAFRGEQEPPDLKETISGWLRSFNKKPPAHTQPIEARKKVEKEQAVKEQAAKEQVAREQVAKEQAAKEQAAKEKIAKVQAAKEQAQADKEKSAKEKVVHEKETVESIAKTPSVPTELPEDIRKNKAILDQIFNRATSPSPVLFKEKFNEAMRYFKEAGSKESVSKVLAFNLYSKTIEAATWAVRYGPKKSDVENAKRKQLYDILSQSLSKKRHITESIVGN